MRYGLSIDAGGIRGIAALVFLIEFVKDRQKVDPSFNINSFFDVFVGSSVGGLLCTMLSVTPCLTNTDLSVFIADIVGGLFTPTRSVLGSFFSPKYTSDGLSALYKKYVPDLCMRDVKQKNKRLIIPAFDISQHMPVVFDSFSTQPDVEDTKLLDVCIATCAYPGMFPPHAIGHSFYIDGGLVQTNPVMLAAGKRECEDVKFISIGSGIKYSPVVGEHVRTWGMFQWLTGGIMDYVGDPRVTDAIAHDHLQSRYLRINSVIPWVCKMDDTSVVQITRLIKLGKSWYWDNREELWTFLGFNQ